MCDPLVTPRPFGPLRDVAAQLDAAVPALLQSGAAQHEIFAAVLEALRGAPHVLIVEDLHWGDEATLDLVRFLARRIATLPLLLVLSYRDAVAVDHPLRTVLGDLVSSPDARRLQLAPLSRSAVARLVEGHDIDADDVHRRTAGNPFFVSQIVAQPDAPLPDSVRDAVVARITALTPPVRHRLELLSCTPEKADAGAAPRARRGSGGCRCAGGHRAGRPPRARRRLPARDRPVRGAGRRHPRLRAGAARDDDRRARGDRRPTPARSPTTPSRPATSRASCGTRPPPEPRPPVPAPTARPSRSTSSRCGTRATTGDARGAAGGTVHGAVPHRPAARRDRGADAGARAAPGAGRRRRGRRGAPGDLRTTTGTRPISRRAAAGRGVARDPRRRRRPP